MIRIAAVVALALAVTGCGRAARESDDPIVSKDDTASIAQASSAAAGETPAAFTQCKICHTTEPGKHLIGPSLAGIYGKPAAAVAGYPYSAALKHSGLTWNDAALDRFLEAPMKAVPGTRMTYAGLKDPAARRELVAYMKTL